MTKQTNRFKAKDASGTEYTIVEYTTFKEVTDLSSPQREYMPTGLSLKTTAGYHVNAVSKGVYDIVDLGMLRVTSTDPNAP